MPILGIMASQISGHLWAPEGAYDALATITVGSTAVSSVEFAGIPSGYKHLQLRVLYRDDTAGSGDAALWAQFNGDTGSNYSWHRLYGNGSTAAAQGVSSTTWGLIGIGAYGGNTANQFGASVIDFLDYANTSKNKTTRGLTGSDANGNGYAGLHSSLWQNTAAINSIKLYPTAGQNFVANCQFALYGVK